MTAKKNRKQLRLAELGEGIRGDYALSTSRPLKDGRDYLRSVVIFSAGRLRITSDLMIVVPQSFMLTVTGRLCSSSTCHSSNFSGLS